MEIKQQLVSNRKSTYGEGNSCTYITIHETANTNKGTGAQTHANLQSNGYSASWHYQVDDKRAVQSYPHNVRCWHAGDGRGAGNYDSIAIEICVNADGDFKKAVHNTAQLVKKIMNEEGIPLSNVVQHNRWSGKNCPNHLRSGSKGVSWSDFIGMVSDVQTTVKPIPKSPVKPLTAKSEGIVDWMNAKKMDASFSNRATLAKQFGIKNYQGTAAENIELLNKLKNSVAVKKPDPAPTPISARILRMGDSGADVRTMQQALASVYFYPEKGAKNNGVDGVFGVKTRDAVRRFQSVHTPDLVDGIYGPKTRAALDQLMKK